MTKFTIFIGIICTLALIALFAAGQLFQILPVPWAFFYGSLGAMVVLIIGYAFGRKGGGDGK